MRLTRATFVAELICLVPDSTASHSRPPSRAGSRHGSPDGSPRSGHRIDPASVITLLLRCTCADRFPLPQTALELGSGAGSAARAERRPRACRRINSSCTRISRLPFPFRQQWIAFVIWSGDVGTGAGGAGLLQPTPVHHPMVILTPTTAEWKELQKEMEDEGVGSDAGMSSASSLGDDSASGKSLAG